MKLLKSYTEYLELVESGKVENIQAPKLAIIITNLVHAKLSDLIRCEPMKNITAKQTITTQITYSFIL